MKFAESARDILTNFARICQIRTIFVRISYKFVRNSYENRTNFVRIPLIQAQRARDRIPGFLLGTVWA